MAELRTRVEERWSGLGQPSWSCPRDPMEAAADEEYSRVTDPGRYRVVQERARVWADLLGELPGVIVERLGPGEIPGETGDRPLTPLTYQEGLRLRSERPGTLPLFLLQRVADLPEGGTLAMLHVCVARPGVELTVQPDCGCDACDSGSADLLEAIDQEILVAVGGPLAIVRASGWHAVWHPEGGASGGVGAGPDHVRVVDLCRRLAVGERPRLPPGASAYVGRSWLT